MAKTTFNIPNISCGHCVMAIKTELSEIDGVQSVDGNPEEKTMTVEWDSPASLDLLKNRLAEINYPVK